MPGSLTDYVNNKVLDLIFGSSAFSPPATLYFGLSQTTANKSGSYQEPTGGSYNRVAVGNNLSTFSVAASGTKSNSASVTFPAPTSAWGTIFSLFIADAAAGGNILAMADLTTPKTITGGGPPASIAVGALFLSHT